MDFEMIIRAVLSLAFVVGLIGFCAVTYKKYVLNKNIMSKNSEKKMKIEEILYIDSKRKLVLIKKEKQEILLLISPNSETVIKSPILKPRSRV